MCSKIFLVFFVTSSTSIFASPVSVLGVDDDRTELCKEKLCIPKCCEQGKYLNSSKSVHCINSDKEYSLSHFNNMPVYGIFANGTLNKVTHKKLGDIPFCLVPGRMYEKVDNETFERKYPFVAEAANMESYLTETGHVYLENTEIELLNRIQYFCVEYVLSPTHDEAKPQIISIPYEGNDINDLERENKSNRTYYSAIISSVFLVIVLLVYIALPELRNLGGMILMAYVTSLLFAFIILAVMQEAAPAQSYICIYRTASLYFFLLSAFCWMNVMSIDIWWTFRGYAKARPIHRRGEHFKFCMYGLYGWGLPGIMTAGLVVVNAADLSQWPWIITPRIPNGGCFLMGIQKNLYLYTPMTILILSNWMFFLMTAYNIWRLTRGTGILNSAAAAAGNPAAHQKQMTRLKVYLKLSVIMGINWLFESVSSVLHPKFALWEYTDMYNLIIGVAIFFIFVFKKKIYNKLKLRYYELLSRFIDGSSAQPVAKSKSSALTSQTPKSQSNQWRIPENSILRNL